MSVRLLLCLSACLSLSLLNLYIYFCDVCVSFSLSVFVSFSVCWPVMSGGFYFSLFLYSRVSSSEIVIDSDFCVYLMLHFVMFVSALVKCNLLQAQNVLLYKFLYSF